MQIGIIGLSYSGKTTLFHTLTEIHFDGVSASKRDSSQAIVKVPDERLDYLTGIFNPKKKVNATIDILDIAGIQASASFEDDRSSSQFNSQIIGKIKTCDALIHVVRGFEQDRTLSTLNVAESDSSLSAVPNGQVLALVRDIQIVDDELLFTDLIFVETRIEKLEKDVIKVKEKDAVQKELNAMMRWKNQLEQNLPLRELEFDEDEQKYLKNYQPLTAKPLLIALNLSENDVKNANNIVASVESQINKKNTLIEPFFAKIEMELSSMEPDDKLLFMQEYGLKDSPLNRMLNSAYKLLGLQSFFTVGEDETRAWTIKKGMNAQQAAGTIHTDFFNKFIRAEVIAYSDFKTHGSMSKCKEAGCFRLEGKEYICQDGDILNIRHG